MPSGRSASRVSHARRGASPRHSHAERGNEGKRHTPLRLINTEAEILRYFPSPPAPLPEGEGRKKIRENFCFSTYPSDLSTTVSEYYYISHFTHRCRLEWASANSNHGHEIGM